MGLVVLVVSGFVFVLMVKGVLGVPIEGSIPLFMLGVALKTVRHHFNWKFLWAHRPFDDAHNWGY